VASPLVLLHGFTHTSASWDPVIAALDARDHALAPDIRGHGTASALQPVTLESVIDDLDSLAPERFTLAGYSMGGRIALHAALAFGARVQGLVLIGASPGLADASERRQRTVADERLARSIEASSIEAFAERWARTPVLAGQPPAVAASVHADRLRNTTAGLARALRGLGTGKLASLWERLGELDLPVTLIVGERDARFRAVAEEMARLLPDPEIVIVPRAGHAVHLEAPAAVARSIARHRP
jgi:2-succinyl-6-hydroxy-2,4-cyclohexadiene-1-carboxylate synthase